MNQLQHRRPYILSDVVLVLSLFVLLSIAISIFVFLKQNLQLLKVLLKDSCFIVIYRNGKLYFDFFPPFIIEVLFLLRSLKGFGYCLNFLAYSMALCISPCFILLFQQLIFFGEIMGITSYTIPSAPSFELFSP